MIDISKLSRDEKRELKIALGMRSPASEKSDFFRSLDLDFIPEEHHYMDIRWMVLKSLVPLADYVCGNYCYGRRNVGIGTFDEDFFKENYKQFVNEVCELMRKHTYLP